MNHNPQKFSDPPPFKPILNKLSYINFHIYVPWLDIYKSFKCRDDTLVTQLCNTISPMKEVELIYKQNILCKGMSLKFYGITNGSLLYAAYKDSREFKIYQEDYQPFLLKDLAQVYDIGLRLNDIAKNKYEANGHNFRKIAHKMTQYYEKQKEQPLKLKKEETKYEKPTMITSQSLPQFWW